MFPTEPPAPPASRDSAAVLGLIDAAKRMQTRKLRRILADMDRQLGKPKGLGPVPLVATTVRPYDSTKNGAARDPRVSPGLNCVPVRLDSKSVPFRLTYNETQSCCNEHSV